MNHTYTSQDAPNMNHTYTNQQPQNNDRDGATLALVVVLIIVTFPLWMSLAGVGMPHAAYAVQTLLGSETLAYFSIDERERLRHLIKIYADRLLAHTKAILGLGIGESVFNWVGPEVYLPPLMGVADFEEFVHDMDKPIGDTIHNGGGYLWVHSHNKVANFIESFIDMGVDVLNPLEPPKNGDIDLNEIVARYGNRIGWEGNIEIQEILLSS